MKTSIGTFSLAGFKQTDSVDFSSLPSNDPIAYYFGIQDAKEGIQLPPTASEEYQELASEYLRGYREGIS